MADPPIHRISRENLELLEETYLAVLEGIENCPQKFARAAFWP